MKRSLPIFAILILLLSCCSNQQSVSSETVGTQQEELEAQVGKSSSGFSPMVNGWIFPNYAPSRNDAFTLNDAVALFGDEAICGDLDSSCLPAPATLEWIEFVNTATKGGVCEGMSVFSASRFLLQDSPQTIDVPFTSEVSKAINRLFATQFLDEVIDETGVWQQSDIKSIVSELTLAFSDVGHEQYTLGIYTDVSGHSVLPYAVEIKDDGTGMIWVYDPNWPKQERYIEFDIGEDSWSYAYFGANQELDNQKWEGTGRTLDLTPLSAREKPFTIPFSTEQSSARNFLAISSIDNEWTLVTKDGVVVDGQNLSIDNDLIYHVYRSQSPRGEDGRLTTVILDWLGDITFTVDSSGTWIRAFSSENTSVATIEGKAVGEMRFSEVQRSDISIRTEGESDAEIRLSNDTDRVFLKVQPEAVHRLAISDSGSIIQVDDGADEFFELEIPTENRRRDVLMNLNRDLIELQLPEYRRGGGQESGTSPPSGDESETGVEDEKPISTPTPTPEPTPTPTLPEYVEAYIYVDPSYRALYVSWEPGGGSQLEPEEWHVEVMVESDAGQSTMIKTFLTPSSGYPLGHTFTVSDFYPNNQYWPDWSQGPNGHAQATITVSYMDEGILSTPSVMQGIQLNNGGN